MPNLILANIEPIIVPTIPGDLFPGTSPNTYVYSAYQGIQYEVILTFRILDSSSETPVDVDIDSMTFSTNGVSGMTLTISNTTPSAYKIRLAGAPQSNLDSGTFSLVLPTNDDTKPFPTITVPSTGTLPQYIALYDWVPPVASYVLAENAYRFRANGTYDLDLSQYIFWSWENGLALFNQTLNNGSI